MPAEVRSLVYKSGDWEVDIARRELRSRGVVAPLDGRAFEVIEILARAAGSLVNKCDLINGVWPGAVVEENTLQPHISTVRKALGSDRTILKTVAGRGYQLLGTWTVQQNDTPPVPANPTPAAEYRCTIGTTFRQQHRR
ncbi:winged helix-turn-helix domain-containing protein [Bradyrhizobium sp. McL0616]|uniref:winged helix-turn-helix domain-containing protein n=1 Tax=Bradyrhizobium sp. McL0616 TaxID=3415674 RepID=UPI003CFB5F15